MPAFDQYVSVSNSPITADGETGRVTCHFIVLSPDQIDTRKPSVVTIDNIAEQVQSSR